MLMSRLLVINGPNLNLLGTREPAYYGNDSLNNINNHLLAQAKQNGHELSVFQSNAEHELVERIHRAHGEAVECLILNPAAFTHTSVALRDALLAVQIPFIEVHLSNTQAREEFRHHSFFSDIALGIISGFGAHGYDLALQAALNYLAATES